MKKRLGYTTAVLIVLLTVLWAFQPSTSLEDGSSLRIKLEPPVALAQSSNFPVEYAGIARYIKFDPIDFAEIQDTVSKTATDIKKTDGTSYVWITITDTDLPVYDLYADVNGWVVLFLPKQGQYSNTLYMFARGWQRRTYTTDVINNSGWVGHHETLAYRSNTALYKFVNPTAGWSTFEVRNNSSFYHFSYPLATSIYIANEVANRDNGFSFFVPDTLTIEEVSTEFWALEDTNSLSIDGAEVYKDKDKNITFLDTRTLGTGRHAVELQNAGVTLAIIVR